MKGTAFVASAAMLLATNILPGSENLVRNGDFAAGKARQPAWWSKIDGLTLFWDEKGNPGRCLRFDPTVLQVDKKRHEQDPESFTGRSGGGQYQTVGAHEGVWAFCWPIEIRPDDRYFIIEADVTASVRSTNLFYPQVLIRGYQRVSATDVGRHSSFFQIPHEGGPAYSEQFGKEQRPAQEGDYLQCFRHSLVCRVATPGKWERYRMGLRLPDAKRFHPDVLLLKLYAMWPLGDYYFDNISLRRATKDEYDAAKAKGHSIKGFAPSADDVPIGRQRQQKRPER